MENDYSQAEINNIIEELTTIHIGKLKPEELKFLTEIAIQYEITQEQRDRLIKLYDAIGEPGY